MAVTFRREASIDVIEAGRMRIKNLFSNGIPIQMSFSGGKDSLCLAHLTYDLILKGEIRADLLTVIFIDEEAIFPCVEKVVLEWRKKFLMVGAKFIWFAMEYKHFNCFNMLSTEETFICFDRYKEDVWVRRPPKFAVRSHPLLVPREDTYQNFLSKFGAGTINMIGVRTAESVQRLQNIARSKKSITGDNKTYPIYDWSNNDVWLYLLNNKVNIPDIYLYLYQIGEGKNKLRVSQFFSNDTAGVLVRMNEYYPDLMKRVIAREPNAYLASLYWDTEIFGKRTAKRRQMEQDNIDSVNYKEKLAEIFKEKKMKELFDTEHKMMVAKTYKNAFFKIGMLADNKQLKRMYEAVLAGDPKLRTLRAINTTIQSNYVKENTETTVIR